MAQRLTRERRTIEAMIGIYCREQHGRRPALCDECEGLRAYAAQRLEHCPFGADKPTCVNCRVHCYRAEMRERVRQVMRYAGPKMLWHHPILALVHLWIDGHRRAPERPTRAARGRTAPG